MELTEREVIAAIASLQLLPQAEDLVRRLGRCLVAPDGELMCNEEELLRLMQFVPIEKKYPNEAVGVNLLKKVFLGLIDIENKGYIGELNDYAQSGTAGRAEDGPDSSTCPVA